MILLLSVVLYVLCLCYLLPVAWFVWFLSCIWMTQFINRRRKDWLRVAVSALAIDHLRQTFASVVARLLLSTDFSTARRDARNNLERPCLLPKLLWLSLKGIFSSLKYSPCSSCCHVMLFYSKYIKLSSLEIWLFCCCCFFLVCLTAWTRIKIWGAMGKRCLCNVKREEMKNTVA